MEHFLTQSDYKHIVILTGAGISAESGIKTFRDQNGLWENHRIEDVASPEGFERNPPLVYDFYNKRRGQLLSPEVGPNPGHYALARLEEQFHGQTLLITQNVDNLHEQAGQKKIIHMHGELLKMRCMETHKIFPAATCFDSNTKCPCCQRTKQLRPHIVWFGETPLGMDEIQKELSQCDLFFSIGTSGHVYPAAMFIQIAKYNGARTVEINKEATGNSSLFDKTFFGQSGEILPGLIETFLQTVPQL
jgi:NAD-dependent deacetylase